MRVKVDRNAQLVHDCYVHVTLPDIYSSIAPINQASYTGEMLAPDATGIGYEFEWIPNIGYNMINSVSVLINGSAIVTHTGEWMKLYSYLTHDGNKRNIIDQMVGNVPELYDPANALGKRNQYPHSISTKTQNSQPSILARELVIPLHFWFCEDIGSALPLVSLQYSEVEFVVEFASIYDLFTIRDVRQTLSNNQPNPTFGQRIRADPAYTSLQINNFLSPPDSFGNLINNTFTTWALNPYVEANYIFIGDAEVIHLAKSDNSFKIKDNRQVSSKGLYGAGNDIELTLVNLCTRIVWISQRSDIAAQNGVDNYTNQVLVPYSKYKTQYLTPWFNNGLAIGQNQSADDNLIDATIVLDGAERFSVKPVDFFSLLQNYKHNNGRFIQGIYTYSFSLEHLTNQPSGHINGSMFNKTLLRLTLQDPPFLQDTNSTEICVVKSTVFNPRPTPVANPAMYNADQVVRVSTKSSNNVRTYTYNIRAYVESYNFLRITRGIANIVFSS
jgi:hypothetical protein